jgi:hypothetical protein
VVNKFFAAIGTFIISAVILSALAFFFGELAVDSIIADAAIAAFL